MGYSKAQARKVKNAVLSGDEQATSVLTSMNTVQVIEFTGPAAKVSLQSTGNLAFTYAPSVNGVNFDTPVSVAANVISSYNTHNIAVMKISWVSGSGQVVLLATA